MSKNTRAKKAGIKKLKEKTHKLYRGHGSLWCPTIKDNVVFNRYGWVHLSFNRNGHRRSSGDVKLRHHLFEGVHEVVQNSKVAMKTFGSVTSKSSVKRSAMYYELVYLVKGKRRHTSVVLRKIEDGKLHFYSVRRTNNKIKKALKKGGLI